MIGKLRHLVIGPPLPTQQISRERLNKVRGLASFSPDALSSIAYANQEIFLGLAAAGSAGLALSWPLGLAITGLMVIVGLSYFQTISGYPNGGGSYVVARENLGTRAGLAAAAALLIDYVLTSAVSLTAGTEALASAFPALWPHRVAVALGLLVVITALNLRGVRETGTLMAFPVYLFLLVYLPMIVYGLVRLVLEGPGSLQQVAPAATSPLTALLVLRTFAAGCTALTGVEAISNGVPYFKPPEARNAQQTLLAMVFFMALLFLGSIGLTQALAVIPGPQETILSALARRVVGSGPAYYLVQFSTLAVLAVASNTSFAGFPQLTSLLAHDGFLPHQFAALGDRLVLANGILFLSVASATLIVVFGGDTHALIPLFAVGAFLAFTLSQAGMVLHWLRERGRAWRSKAAFNGFGALVTSVALVVIAIGKFAEGAWLTFLVIPLLVVGFEQIRRHYRRVSLQLSMDGFCPSPPIRTAPRVVIPISGVHRGTADALDYARLISKDVTAVHIEMIPGSGERVRERWQKWWPDIPLVILPSPYRSLVGPLLDYLDRTDEEHADGQLATVVLPEFVPARWWHGLLHNQSAWILKAALLYRRRHLGFQRAIIDLPFHLKD